MTCVRADEVLLERLFQNLLELFVADLGPGGRRRGIRVQGGSVAEVRLCREGASDRPVGDFGELLRGLVQPSAFGGVAAKVALPVGLRICQRVIEAHAGTLAVEDLAGRPLCLVVRVPAASL